VLLAVSLACLRPASAQPPVHPARPRTEIEAGLASLADGDVYIYIRVKDPAYATPGPDEVQKF
jgi:hypothetical protein